MAIDRAAALRNAEKLLRQGKLDQAIAEYVRVVDDQPTDWNTRNTLGDLYVRAGQTESAVAEYARIADAFRQDGFFSKAGALYRKILKFKPDDEHSLLQGAEIAATQGLLADARSALSVIIERRRARGDVHGALTLVVRLAALDPADVDARVRGAKAMAELGDPAGALRTLRTLADELRQKQQHARASEVLQVATALAPTDLGLSIEALEVSLSDQPHDVPVLSRLLELLVDAGLDDRVADTQARLADAHLFNGFATEARWIAEDLVVRYPADETHQERLRRVLRALGEPNVDRIITEIVGGASPLPPAEEPAAFAPPPVAPVESTPLVAMPVLSSRDQMTEAPAIPDPAPSAIAPAWPEPIAPPPSPPGPAPVTQRSPVGTVAQAKHRSENIEIDLSVVLDQIHRPQDEAPSPDLDDVFAQMRDEARRRTAIDSAEQDYKRGITLFQAGQVEESIAALKSAAIPPRFRFEAASLLGRIFLNRGDLPRAIEWLDRAADAPAPSPADLYKVLYNLADALESEGETAKALAVCLQLQASAGVFRDVAARIKRLSAVQARG